MIDNVYFNINLEFNKERFDSIIEDAIRNNKVGYVCSVESNNLTIANRDPEFKSILNSALVNNCDGSILAKILGHIHHETLDSYIGADIFMKYIQKGVYRHFFLGNTSEVLNGLRENLTKIDPKIKNMHFETLPFRKVDDFDYPAIAKMINDDVADIIWVSLGAPKQEIFMNHLQPYLNRGVMFGFGAIFNFYAGVGKMKRAPEWMLNLRLEWLYRLWKEPRKTLPRILNFVRALPCLIMNEINTLN